MIRTKDIAERAGVSPATVSNVIRGNYKKMSKKRRGFCAKRNEMS